MSFDELPYGAGEPDDGDLNGIAEAMANAGKTKEQIVAELLTFSSYPKEHLEEVAEGSLFITANSKVHKGEMLTSSQKEVLIGTLKKHGYLKGKGWHNDKIGHSNARRFGKK